MLALLCVLAAGLLRSRVGYLLGWLVQLLLVATAVWVPVMLFIGLAFAALWVVALVQGSRADALTARRSAPEPLERSLSKEYLRCMTTPAPSLTRAPCAPSPTRCASRCSSS